MTSIQGSRVNRFLLNARSPLQHYSTTATVLSRTATSSQHTAMSKRFGISYVVI